MEDNDGLGEQLAAVARALQSETGTQHTMDRAIEIATEIIEGCDAACVSIVHRGRGMDTPAATTDALGKVDELQYALEEGPCLDAIWSQDTVHSPDLANDPRWPRWGPHVVSAHGMKSTLSFQLFTTKETLGTLNLYSRTVDAFTADDISNGLYLAAHLAVAIADSQHAEHLESAITNRTMIGQAEGILMERFSISADQAFAVLRRVSQDRQVKLHEVASQLVQTRQTPQ